MSDFGFRISANDGTLAVSEKTFNPVYIGDATPFQYEEGPLYAKTDYYLSRVWHFSISSSERPIPFLVPYNGEVLALIQVKQTGVGSWEIIVGQGVRTSPPRVLCFSKSMVQSASGYGIAVWDSSGKLCFDSNKNHLIVDAVGISPPMTQACSPGKTDQGVFVSFPMGNSTANLSRTVNSPAFFAGTITCGGCQFTASGYPFYGMGLRAFRIQNGTMIFSAWAAAAGGAFSSGPVGFLNNSNVYVAVTDSSRY